MLNWCDYAWVYRGLSMAETALKQFMFDYFNRINFNYWEKRASMTTEKLKRLKTLQAKSPYIIDYYSMYVQLLEILFINTLILSGQEQTFINYLFMDNQKLRVSIKDNFNREEFLNWYLDNYVFGLTNKQSINNYEEKRKQYLAMLKEFYKDYMADYDFLNSFKHGYRVQASHKASVSINGIEILNLDTALTYYKKINNVVYEMDIMLNHKRVGTKVYFLLSMLQNSQKVFLSQAKPGKEIKLDHYLIEDKDEWTRSFGFFRTQRALFTVTKKKTS
jgi:hypothetical protein